MSKRNSQKAISSSNRVNIPDRDRIMPSEPGSSSVQEDSGHMLSPIPVSFDPMATLMASQDRPKSNSALVTRRKRERCEIKEISKISFELFQHQEGGRNYILSANEIRKGSKTYHLSLVKNKQKWIVSLEKISSQSNLIPVSQITDSPLQPDCYLSLQQRLTGWIAEKRARNITKTGACDKYYYHESDPKCFRSLIEVAIFLLYSCRRKCLNNTLDIAENEENVKSCHDKAGHCNPHKSEGDCEGERHTSSCILTEIQQEEIQGQGKEKPKDADAEEQEKPIDVDAEYDEIYAWVLANPIVDLEPLNRPSLFTTFA